MTMPILRGCDAIAAWILILFREAANYTAKSRVSARISAILRIVAGVVAGLMSIW
jgi:hypothetical protein